MRNSALDIARYLAAAAVVWLHACQSESLAFTAQFTRFAVPFFAVAAGFGLSSSLQRADGSFLAYLKKRFLRLYVPFVAWSLIYVSFKLVKQRLVPEQESLLPGWEILWHGGAYHLWFLSFLLLASLAAFPLLKSIDPSITTLVAVVVFLASLMAVEVLPVDDGSGSYAALAGQAFPAFLMGICLELLWRSRRSSEASRLLTASSVLFFGLATAPLIIYGRNPYFEDVAGIALFAATLSCPRFCNLDADRWKILGQLAFGVYLSHLLWIKIGESLARKLDLPSTSLVDIGLFASALLLATATAYGLAKYRMTRWLVA